MIQYDTIRNNRYNRYNTCRSIKWLYNSKMYRDPVLMYILKFSVPAKLQDPLMRESISEVLQKYRNPFI